MENNNIEIMNNIYLSQFYKCVISDLDRSLDTYTNHKIFSLEM